MKIVFGKPLLDHKEKKIVERVLKSPILVHGKFMQKFENSFSKFTKAPYAISVSSCTAAMHLFYLALGLKNGDEVIVSSQTHVATAHAIELTGAKPVFIDSNNVDGNIDIKKLENKINKKTKAISIVHYLGIPADMTKIVQIAKKYNLKVMEDCALAIGSKIKNKHVGLFGDAGAFSFYPAKHMTTAEGGMLICKDKKLAKKIKTIRGIGVDKSFDQRKFPGIYNVPLLGLNYRLSEINSAIGLEQLKKIKKFIQKRKVNYNYLFNKLKTEKNLKQIDLTNYQNLEISPYCFPLMIKNINSHKRSRILLELKKYNIGSSVYYPHPVPRLIYYKNKYGYKKNNFKNAEMFSDKMIVLPIGPHISLKMIDYMSNKIKEILRKVIR
jgi:perosamine synthetase